MDIVHSMVMECWLEDVFPVFNTLLQTCDRAGHQQGSSLNQHFINTLSFVWAQGKMTENEIEKPLLDCLILAEKMSVSWGHLGSELQKGVLETILHEAEDGHINELESILQALANIGLRWENLRPEFKNEITKLYLGGQERRDEVDTELRSSYISSLSLKNLSQWIESLILLGLTSTEITQMSPDLWQRYKSSRHSALQILQQFNRTWAQKGYEFPEEVLIKIGYFTHHNSSRSMVDIENKIRTLEPLAL